MSTLFSPLIENAIRLACYWHAGQLRTGDEAQTFTHLTAVAMILSRADLEETVIAAGFCHDLLEDTECPTTEIAEACNEAVLKIVQTVTVDPRFDTKTQWQAQKEAYVEAIRNGPIEAKAVCAADRIHNLQTLMAALEEYGMPFFSYFKEEPEQKLWFEDQVSLMLQSTWNHTLVSEYDQLLDKFVELLEVLDEEEKKGVARNPLPQEETNQHPIQGIVDESINALESILPFGQDTEEEEEPVPYPQMSVEDSEPLPIKPNSKGVKKKSPEAVKYLSEEEFQLLLPAAIQLGIDKDGINNQLIRDSLGVNYLTAYRLLKELKRLHVIKRADGTEPRKIIIIRAKELLREIKKLT